MVALLIRLKVALWKAQYRKNPWGVVGAAVGGVYGLGMAGLIVAGLIAGAAAGEEVTLWLPAIAGALGLAWALIPLVSFGLSNLLALERFALLPVRGRTLLPGLYATAFLSIPSLLTALALAGVAVAGGIGLLGDAALPFPARIAAAAGLVVGCAVSYALTILAPRALTALLSLRSSNRRRSEIAGVAALVGFVAVVYGVTLLANAEGFTVALTPQALEPIARVLGWTPFGAPLALVHDLTAGAVLPALGRLVLVTASAAGLLALWRVAIDRALVSAAEGPAVTSGAELKGSFVLPGLPHTVTGTVASRSLRYWRRDSRYLANVLVLPLVLVFLVGLGVTTDQGSMALFGAVLVAAMAGMAVSNDFGFDGPASWVHLVANVPARADVRGRLLAAAIVISPLLVLPGVVVPFVLGDPRLVATLLPWLLGIGACSLALSLLAAMLFPYPAMAPGGNPLKDKSTANLQALLGMTLSMLGAAVPLLPAIALLIAGLVAVPVLLPVSGALALVAGLVVCALVPRWTGTVLERRRVGIFAAVRAWSV